jgi:alpha-1,3-mannosyltransferase
MHVVLPLMGSIIKVIRYMYLGPEHCVLSIVEGHSTDNTYEILAGLKDELTFMGLLYSLDQNPLDPKGDRENRIANLAKLHNMALAPLVKSHKHWFSPYASDITVIFLNDIVLCIEDILELLY